jgi:hypothetical protein
MFVPQTWKATPLQESQKLKATLLAEAHLE